MMDWNVTLIGSSSLLDNLRASSRFSFMILRLVHAWSIGRYDSYFHVS